MIAVLILVGFVQEMPTRASTEHAAPVGLPMRIEGLVLPGSELEVKPLADRRSPLVLRIVNVWPHGSAFRYELEVYGLDAGSFDLGNFLRRKDGSTTAGLPPIPVMIQRLLPAGQILPADPQIKGPPRLGGYFRILVWTTVLWLAGLFAILFVGRRRHRNLVEAESKPQTAAEHLRPLIDGAMAGKLNTAQLADLERSLLIYWQRRLNLQDQKPFEAIARLREHPEAGPLLKQLEAWLHQAQPTAVAVATLLEPYRRMAADIAEPEEASP
jgi:hypothetical protein